MTNNNLTLVRTLKDVQTDESLGGLQEIREIREKLGQFTLRDMTEAVMGSVEYADILLSEEEGNTKMSDLDVEFRGDESGNLVTRVPLGRQLTHENAKRAADLVNQEFAKDTPEAQARRLKENQDAMLREQTTKGQAYQQALDDEITESIGDLSLEEREQLKMLLRKMHK